MKKQTLLAVALLLHAAAAHAGMPTTLNYQGRMRDKATGLPVADSTANSATFRLFNAASGGTMVWSEMQTNVSTTAGLFNVILGSANPLNVPFDQPYYLEIVWNTAGEVMAPRTPLTAGPYAFTAHSLELPFVGSGGGSAAVISVTALSAIESGIYAGSNSSAPTAEFDNGGFGSPLKVNALSFPSGPGISGQVLSTDGSSAMSWVNPSTVAAPLGLTLNSATNVPLSLSNASGAAVLAQGVTGAVLSASSLGLSVTASSGTGTGIYAHVNSTVDGIRGDNDGAGPGVDGRSNGGGIGVFGSSGSGIGVYGRTSALNASGVYAQDQSFSGGMGLLAEALGAGGGGKAVVASANQMGVSSTATDTTLGQAYYGSVSSTSAAAEFINAGLGTPLKLNGMKFPSTDSGFSGKFLGTDGFGNLTWSALSVAAPVSLSNASGSTPTLYTFNSSGTAVMISAGANSTGALIAWNNATASPASGVIGLAAGNGPIRAGVIGSTAASYTGPAFADGIYGYSQFGVGVEGFVDGATNSTYGIYAHNGGTNNFGYGIKADNSSANGAGIWANNSSASGAAVAVSASSSSVAGTAVVGTVSSTAAAAAFINNNVNGTPLQLNNMKFPATDSGFAGKFLGTDGAGNLTWTTASIGAPLSLSGASAASTLSAFNGFSGNAIFGQANTAGGAGLYGKATVAGAKGLVAEGFDLAVSATATQSSGEAVYGRVSSTSAAAEFVNDNVNGTPLKINNMKFPSKDTGLAGTFLGTDGAGNLTWTTVSVTAPLNLTSVSGSQPAIYAYNSGNGTTMLISGSASSTGSLIVTNNAVPSPASAVIGLATGFGPTRIGVLGSGDPTFTNPSGANGIYGYSISGTGVRGLIDGGANASQAIYGLNSGAANTGSGVRAENSSTTGVALFAINSAASGAAVAVSASSSSPAGEAYFARVSSSAATAEFVNDNASGTPLKVNGMKFPSTDTGFAGKFLGTDGAGNLTWTAVSVSAPLSLSTSTSVSALSLFSVAGSGLPLYVQGNPSGGTPAAEILNNAANNTALVARGGSGGGGVGVLGQAAIGVYGQNAGVGTDAVWAIASSAGSRGLVATGDAAGVSATADAAAGSGILVYQTYTAATGPALAAYNTGAGSTAPGILGITSNSGPAIEAWAQGAGPALRLSGTAKIDSYTNTITMASYVSFTAGTNLLAAPMTLTGTVGFPGAVLTLSNYGDGESVVGYATQPGGFAGGSTPSFNSSVTSGLKGYTNVSNSAGVAGYSQITTTAGLGVIGLGMTGVGGYGRSDVAGSRGGDFNSDAMNGVGVSGNAQTGTAGTFSGLTGVVANGSQMGLVVSGGAIINNLTYPTLDGIAGQVLTTDGAGHLTLSSGTVSAPLNLTGTSTPALYAFNSSAGTAMSVSGSSSGGAATLMVKNSGSPNGYGILSIANGNGISRAGVLGATDNNFQNPPNAGAGVEGYSLNGYGIYGYTNGGGNTAAGVRGENTINSGYGVIALNSASSGNAIGLSATSLSSAGTAGIFQGFNGVWGVAGSSGRGVVGTNLLAGTTMPPDTAGVVGTVTTGYGVFGHTASTITAEVGVWGENLGTGATPIGVLGTTDPSPNIFPVAATGVFGTASSGVGVGGSSNTLYGVWGKSTGAGLAPGVWGENSASVNSVGVLGATYSGASPSGVSIPTGVYGYNGLTAGAGVMGLSTIGWGVIALSNSGVGLYASGTVMGISATSSTGTGIVASGSSAGISATASAAGIGIYGTDLNTFSATTAVGVKGEVNTGNANSAGVQGFNSGTGISSKGVYGTSYNGVWGFTNTGGGHGVVGTDLISGMQMPPDTGGVVGTVGAGYGVWGHSATTITSEAGVYGEAANGIGVVGYGGAVGVSGSATSSSGTGVLGIGGSNTAVGIFASNTATLGQAGFPTGSALSISGAVKTSFESITVTGAASTLVTTANDGPAGHVFVTGATAVTKFTVNNTLVTPNSTIIFNYFGFSSGIANQWMVSVNAGNFEILLTTAQTFGGGTGFNYLIIN